jgi:hypothetical protein
MIKLTVGLVKLTVKDVCKTNKEIVMKKLLGCLKKCKFVLLNKRR